MSNRVELLPSDIQSTYVGQSSIEQPPSRDLRFDFARGLALLIIYTNHVDGNFFTNVTPARFGFSDMAEVFVFISGYSCGLAYSRKIRRNGFVFCARKIWYRSLRLYTYSIVTLAGLWLLHQLSPVTIPIYYVGDCTNFIPTSGACWSCLFNVISLQCQALPFFILPLYLMLMLPLPFVLFAEYRARLCVWIASLILYGLVQAFPDTFTLPEPWRSSFYVNPLAWQFLFVSGLIISRLTNESKRMLGWKVTIVGSIVFLECSFLAKALFGLQVMCVEKENLELLRLTHFFCIYIICRQLLPGSAWFQSKPVLEPVIACGQNSLQIYVLGGWLTIPASFLIVRYEYNLFVQISVNIVGWLICFCAAIFLKWKNMKIKS